MDFKLRHDARYASNDDLLKDLRKVALDHKIPTVSQRLYNSAGNYTHKTFCKRFGSWNNALMKAGLETPRQSNIPTSDLFDNLELIWLSIGRQPLYSEIRKPFSKYSVDVYCKRFGGWREACKAFIKNKKGYTEFEKIIVSKGTTQSRYISEKTRLIVFHNDKYRCVKCGKSPATHSGCVLHVDHKIPHSKGGTNDRSNLQTLCNKCNLAKGNDETLR